jgi:hypothetical protein
VEIWTKPNRKKLTWRKGTKRCKKKETETEEKTKKMETQR